MHRLLHSADAKAEDACRRLLDALPDNYEHMGGPASLSTPNGLAARLWAQWALTHLSPAAAEEALAAPMPGFELWRDLRRAHCLARLGQRREAVALLREVWAACPCHPNLVLALHDLAFPPFCSAPAVAPHEPLPPLALYSWNKADVLAQTLHSLRATEGADAPVFVLDNGSTDGTRLHLGQALAIGEHRGAGLLLDDGPQRLFHQLADLAAGPAAVVDLGQPVVDTRVQAQCGGQRRDGVLAAQQRRPDDGLDRQVPDPVDNTVSLCAPRSTRSA